MKKQPKEIWQMTQKEYLTSIKKNGILLHDNRKSVKQAHKNLVIGALLEKNHVSRKVVEDYPDIKKLNRGEMDLKKYRVLLATMLMQGTQH